MGAQAALVQSLELQYELAYTRFSDDVFRFALAWTNDWAAAEDLVQETFLRLWQHRARIGWDRPIQPWLMVTTRHLANNRFRALRRHSAPLPEGPIADESVWARWLDVRSALATLTPVERTALLLTAIEGWSYAELAEVLDTTDGALRAAVSRARTKLEVA